MSTDLFNIAESSAAGSFLEERKAGQDGLLRPKIEEGKNGKRELVIRFLPNFSKEMQLGPTAIEKHIHYANFPQNPDLQGYFDCQKHVTIGTTCTLCDAFWALKNDKNPEKQDRAKKISRTTKYYSYVYVVEDKQVPENEGKIFIFPFGYKIFQKIKAQAENSRKPIRVEDLMNGANLVLNIEEVGGFVNYDASYFEGASQIEITGLDIETDAKGRPTKATQEALIEFLLNREFDLEDYLPKAWTPEQHDKANKIVALLTGTEYTATHETATKTESVSAASIFGDDDDEDEAPVVKKTKKAVVIDEDDEDDEDDEPITTTRSKASKYFEDDED